MKLELGGGAFPRGDGFVSVDIDPAADVIHNLETFPYPFESDSVTEVYSSHCLEHLAEPQRVLDEICRICVIGAQVEIRVPHPHSHLSFTSGHKHCFSPVHAINIDKYHPQHHWRTARRMRLQRMELHPTFMLAEAKRELPFLHGLSDNVIMKWIAGTCHETRFFYTVTDND